MAEKIGNYTIKLKNKPVISGFAAVVGKKEAEGPLGAYFDVAYSDEFCGEKTFEKAETHMQKTAIKTAVRKAGLHKIHIDCAFAGDLLNQCIGSSFGMRDLRFPFCGLYGACSTMALSMALSGIFVDSGAAQHTVAAASSHFCSAERQYRYPLEYGGQRTPAAQWTVTGAGACVVSESKGYEEILQNIREISKGENAEYNHALQDTSAPLQHKTNEQPAAQPQGRINEGTAAQPPLKTNEGIAAQPPRKTNEGTAAQPPYNSQRKIYIDKVIIGSVRDLKIKDPNNMGAAMAPEDDRIGTYRTGVCMVFSTNF